MLADIFGPDLLIVVIVLVVVLFGGAAIPKLARNLGSAKNEFEKGLGDAKKNEAKDAAASATGTVAASNGTAAAADTPAPAPTGTPSSDDTAQGN
jgi:sec-independent protein translocase protein TatA